MFHAIGWSNSVRRKESERFKGFTHEGLLKRDKLNLDIFWLKDESLDDSANLPDPDIIAAEIVEDLQAALAQLKFARCPHSLTASLAALLSMSLIPFAPFAAITRVKERPGFPIATDLRK